MPAIALLTLVVTACGAPSGPTAPATPGPTMTEPAATASSSPAPSATAASAAPVASGSAPASATPGASGTAGGAACLPADVKSSISDFSFRDLETKASLAEVADAIDALDLGADPMTNDIRDGLVENLRATDPNLDEITAGANLFEVWVMSAIATC